jgi:serine protease AprX
MFKRLKNMELRQSRFFLFMVISCAFVLSGECGKYKYLVYFSDKAGTQFSIDKPEAFLGPRALSRRSRQNIPIRFTDLPVSKKYIDSLENMVGVYVWYTSRWFNAAYVFTDSSTLEASIRPLGFVKRIEILKNTSDTNVRSNGSDKRKSSKNQKFRISDNEYGQSINQVSMLCADQMQEQGFKGDEMIIAVMDGGFSRADNLFFFDSLYLKNRILGTYDFVSRNPYVYGFSDHGTQVLSCIAGYANGSLIGTAPHAKFYLFRTEEEATEYPVEEANWLMAAERADSLGVDVINTSLGYTTFDSKVLNHTYADLNGKTTIISRAASIAASKGMICVVSAGNNGNDWDMKYVAAPADADSILAVGAVSSSGTPAGFTAYGPTFDKRIKPDVAAMGVNAIVGKPSNEISSGNGTSFAAPILCGMVTGLWQSLPELTNMEIINLVKSSGSKFDNPDDRVGYGIPCFTKARLLSFGKSVVTINDTRVVPNPFSEGSLALILGAKDIDKTVLLEIYDVSGKIMYKQLIPNSKLNNPLNMSPSYLNSDLYFVRISANDFTRTIRLIKQ